MVKIVRNPLDVTLSAIRGLTTGSHSLVPIEQFDKDLPEFWATAVETGSEVIAKDHEMTISDPDSLSAKIPTYFIRFEDIVNDPIPVFKEMFKFLLDAPSIEGTVLEKRINEKCTHKSAPQAVYKLKAGSSQNTVHNKNAHMYSEEQIARLKQTLKDHL